MDGERIAMSQNERDRLKVMASVMDGRRTQAEAARLMKRSVRQVRRIQRRVESEGDCGVIHKLRGRPSNNGEARSVRREVVEIYRRDYSDFGPTLASEKLLDRGYRVCDETLRLWLLSEKLWQPRQRRDRRECFGELVQADGSHHDWLEGRGPRMVLLVMIDDATSRAMARFYPGETTEGYMDLLWRHVRRHGRMVDLYTDKDSIFWGESMGKEPSRTQFTRALEELGIGWIPAHSPQAKGRVERFHRTAQDRLVKELRLANATNMEQVNAVLEKEFLPWFNRRCVVKAGSPNDAHRGLDGRMKLPSILSLQERRKVANDYTIRLENQVYQLLPPAYPGLRGGWVVVEQRLDGTMQIRFKKEYLAYHLIGPADRAEALPPNPRSLPHGRTPAAGRKKEGQAVVAARPSAVRLTVGRSGRTPAEPCPPKGNKTVTATKTYRPPPEHPWRRRYKGTGHFKLPQKADISICA